MSSVALPLLLNGATLGAAYALAALGFVLALNAVAAVNFAHGDLVMAGGMLAVALAAAFPVDLPGIVWLPLAALGAAGLGALTGLAAYLPLRRKPPVAVFVSTIAVGVGLQNAALLLMGPEPRAVPPLFSQATQPFAIIIVAGLAVAATAVLLARTQFGRRLRAAAQDPDMARACGIPVERLAVAAFALAAALAGTAGALLGGQYFITPMAGGDFMLKTYIAVTIGGWGSPLGAVAGAVLIAFFETGVSLWLSHAWASAALYAATLLILTRRPQGLFGEAAGRRA